MDPSVIDGLCRDLSAEAGLGLTRRESLRVWRLSGVERLHLRDGTTAIFTYAAEPFTGEDQVLIIAADHCIPVPTVFASAVHERILGMMMTDLGEPVREAEDSDGAIAAAALHAVGMVCGLPVVDQPKLTALPTRALAHLKVLRNRDGWADTEDIDEMLHALAAAAAGRADGAQLAPYGFCHSEFHPTSLHIGPTGWHLLDFARAFNGPGLLDLASWLGTLDDPNPARLRGLLDRYVAVGGARDALAVRVGLPAECWALGWHRVWAVEWFMDQALRWIADPDQDPTYVEVVRRHLHEGTNLLAV